MPSKCPVCNREAVDVEEGGELVCTECGAVVEGRVFNFDVDRQNGYTAMTADGTAKFDGRYDLPSTVRQRLPTSDTSVSKKRLQKILFELTKRMNLPNETVKEAKDFLLTTVTSKIKSGEIRHISRHRDILTASCLFIVCRRNHMQINYRRMAEIAQCNMFSLGKSVKIILKALDLQLEPIGTESSLGCVLAQLDVEDKSAEKTCFDLFHIFKYFSLVGERNHFASAMALVLIVLEGKRIPPRKEKIAEVLGKNSVTDTQLKSQSKNTRRGLIELAKDVPWIPKSLKTTAIARHIDDIVDFHKNCGKMDLSAVKSLYMKRKELAQNNRKRKIQMAKARIDKEKTQQLCSSSEDSSSTNDALADPSGSSSSLTNQSKDGDVTGDPVTHNLHVDGVDRGQQSTSADAPEFSMDSELDDNDTLIEGLLRSGYSEEELMDGYFESRMVDLQGSCDPEGEREDLDELDISESDMHHYLKSVAEVERIRNLQKDDSHQAVGQSQ